jgi:hypothetical protein
MVNASMKDQCPFGWLGDRLANGPTGTAATTSIIAPMSAQVFVEIILRKLEAMAAYGTADGTMLVVVAATVG